MRHFIEIHGSEVVVRDYDPQTDTPYKFLYFVRDNGFEVLVVGGFARASGWSTPDHKALFSGYSELAEPIDREFLQGAGSVTLGSVNSWYSTMLNFHTHSKVHARILELLALRRKY